MTQFAGSTAATISLIDIEDQGVCPDGHACFLYSTPEGFVRECNAFHGDPDDPFSIGRSFRSLPLIRWGTTEADITNAAQQGADALIVEWARFTVADRDEDPDPSRLRR